MTVALDHTIVPATDKRASAEFLGGILDLSPASPWGPFVPLPLGNGVTLDFVDAVGFDERHYAFLVDEAEFDAMYERIRASGVAFYADPFRREPGGINHHYGGRGVYFDDPDNHLTEIITRTYGPRPEGRPRD
jgi:catechol 2,3-dioxygenase-like lactoylglutathione lyase family enzyme